MGTTTLRRSEGLKAEALAALAKAQGIIGAAEQAGRAPTDDEWADARKHFDLAKSLNEQRQAALADERVLDEGTELAKALGLGDHMVADLGAQADNDPTRLHDGYKAGAQGMNVRGSLGGNIVASTEFKSLMQQYKQPDGTYRMPERGRIDSAPIPFKSLVGGRPYGEKALWTGGSATSAGAFITPDRTDIVELLGRRPLTIRNLVQVRRTNSDTVEYVAQTSHTNNAAVVPEATSSASPTSADLGGPLILDPNGGYKPEGAWAYTEASVPVRTIAEWVPVTKRALADFQQLEDIINGELRDDLAETEENQILNGNGTGNNFTGINNWSGIQAHARGTDTILDAVRRALTKARTIGRVAPNALVLNPAQVEALDLLKDGQGQYLGSTPFGQLIRTVWGVPVVESEAQPAGTGLLADFNKCVLWDREAANVTMTNSHADFFIRNLVAILAEERLAFAVVRPSAVVQLTGL